MKIFTLKLKDASSARTGMTLIETLIFMALLSFLLGTLISFISAMYEQHFKLMHDIEDQYNKGFIALIAILLVSLGCVVVSIVVMAEVSSYADNVYRHESRIQANLNASSCIDAGKLIVEKDFFMQGTTTLPDLGCDLFVVNDFSGHISLSAHTRFQGVSEYQTDDFLIQNY